MATEAEANCLVRAEVWDSCAGEVLTIPTDQSALARHDEELMEWLRGHGWLDAIGVEGLINRKNSEHVETLARVEAAAYERGKRDAKITIADLSRHPISYALGIVEEAIDALQDRGREADAGERWEEADTKKALDVIDRDFKGII